MVGQRHAVLPRRARRPLQRLPRGPRHRPDDARHERSHGHRRHHAAQPGAVGRGDGEPRGGDDLPQRRLRNRVHRHDARAGAAADGAARVDRRGVPAAGAATREHRRPPPRAADTGADAGGDVHGRRGRRRSSSSASARPPASARRDRSGRSSAAASGCSSATYSATTSFGVGTSINGGVRDIAVGANYLNRTRRMNWGVYGERIPQLSGTFQQGFTVVDGQQVYVERQILYRQTYSQGGVMLAYPFSRSFRGELSTGVRHIGFTGEVINSVLRPGLLPVPRRGEGRPRVAGVDPDARHRRSDHP